MDALLKALQALRAREGGRRSETPTSITASAAPPDRPGGCGWFDSSHDLASGLRVQELVTAEALAVLPLGAWLELELADCRQAATRVAGDFER